MTDSFVIPWTVAHQAPLSMGFFQTRILEWVAISFSRGSEILMSPALAGGFFTTEIFFFLKSPYLLKVKVLAAQSCPTLFDSMDYCPPGSSVRGILQARILERVAMPFTHDRFSPPYVL